MIASELISKLQTEMKLYGDIPVHLTRISESHDHLEVEGLATFLGPNPFILICDPGTLDNIHDGEA